MLKKSPLGDISQHIVHNTLAIHLPNTAPALSDTEQNNTTRNAPTLLNISHTSDINTDLTEISPLIKVNPITDNASTQTAPTNNSSHTPENATLYSKINTTTPVINALQYPNPNTRNITPNMALNPNSRNTRHSPQFFNTQALGFANPYANKSTPNNSKGNNHTLNSDSTPYKNTGSKKTLHVTFS